MSEEIPTNGELMRQMKSLGASVENGFREVHRLQREQSDKEEKNTEFRLKTEGSLYTFKWLFGILGIGNLMIFIKLFLSNFTR